MTFTILLMLALAQMSEPDLDGGELIRLEPTLSLQRAVGVVDDGWLGYAVSAVAGYHDGCGGVFDLESGGGDRSAERVDGASATLFVFARIIDGGVTRIRTVGSRCRIRAGAVPIHWLASVSEEGSLSFLDDWIGRGAGVEARQDALHAVAVHAGAAADARLLDYASSERPLRIREKAVFWMGAARGDAGYEALAELVDTVRERELREKIVFALHVSDAEDATPTLMRVAREDDDTDVRAKALFWLAQEAGEQAGAAIAGAVRDEPELEVKKKAVFALSQLPPDEGVPRLIEVARSHPHPEIRKKALFWLGQSGDPRALALIENVLSVAR